MKVAANPVPVGGAPCAGIPVVLKKLSTTAASPKVSDDRSGSHFHSIIPEGPATMEVPKPFPMVTEVVEDVL